MEESQMEKNKHSNKSMMYLSCVDVLGLDYYIFGSLVY